jgi:hypothetical protein
LKRTTQQQALRRAQTRAATEAARAAGKLFKPGQSGNPGGRPVGARNRLQGRFLNALAADFEEFGRAAIVRARELDPLGYIRLIAQLMPRELEISRPLEDIPEDELMAMIEALRAQIAEQEGGKGADAAGDDEPRPKLQ